MQIWISCCGGVLGFFPLDGRTAERASRGGAEYSSRATERPSCGAAEWWFRCGVSAIYDMQVRRRAGGGGDNAFGFGGDDAHGGDDEGTEGYSDDCGPAGVVFL